MRPHHKDMKYFVGAEILMLRIEDRKLQRIDHTADGIDAVSYTHLDVYKRQVKFR